MRAGILPSLTASRRTAMVLWLWVPTAYTLFLVGFVLSGVLLTHSRTVRLEDVMMSDLMSRSDNPRGYLPAMVSTALCALLLFPAATLMQEAACRRCRGWRLSAAWLYRLGLFAALTMAITSPFAGKYDRLHVDLAFFAFISLIAALAMMSLATAWAARGWRWPLTLVGCLEAAALLFLGYLYFDGRHFEGRRWLIAVYEWAIVLLVAGGTLLILTRDARHAAVEAVDVAGEVE